MFGFGMPELVVILLVVLFVFGTGRLAEVGGAVGKSIRNFKRSAAGRDIEITPTREADGEGKRG